MSRYDGYNGFFHQVGQLITGSDAEYQRQLQSTNDTTEFLSARPQYVRGESSYMEYVAYKTWYAAQTGEPANIMSESLYYQNNPNARRTLVPSTNGASPMYNSRAMGTAGMFAGMAPTGVGGTAFAYGDVVTMERNKPVSGPGIVVSPPDNPQQKEGQIVSINTPIIPGGQGNPAVFTVDESVQQQIVMITNKKLWVNLMFRLTSTGPGTCTFVFPLGDTLGGSVPNRAVTFATIFYSNPGPGIYTVATLPATILANGNVSISLVVDRADICAVKTETIVDLDGDWSTGVIANKI